MKSIFIAILVFAALSFAACQKNDFKSESANLVRADIEDFHVVEGDWTGSLTYTDYGSGERVVIPTHAVITVKSANKIIYKVSYPEEPWEDSVETVKLSKDGLKIEGNPLLSRTALDPSGVEYVTKYEGEDDNQPVIIKQTYILTPDKFSISKDVKPIDGTEFINRNIYAFIR